MMMMSGKSRPLGLRMVPAPLLLTHAWVLSV